MEQFCQCVVCNKPVINNRDCSACHSLFCLDHLLVATKETRQCPICSTPFTDRKVTSSAVITFDQLFVHNVALQRIVNEMRTECPMGCGVEIKISDMEHHKQTSCEQTFCVCLHHGLGCDWKGLVKERSEHVRSCPFEKVIPLIRRYQSRFDRWRGERSEIIKVIKEQKKIISELQVENHALVLAMKRLKRKKQISTPVLERLSTNNTQPNEETVVYNMNVQNDTSNNKPASEMFSEWTVEDRRIIEEASKIIEESNYFLDRPTSTPLDNNRSDSLSSTIIFDTTAEILNELVKERTNSRSDDQEYFDSPQQLLDSSLDVGHDYNKKRGGFLNSLSNKKAAERKVCIYAGFSNGDIMRFDDLTGSGEKLSPCTKEVNSITYHRTGLGAKYVCAGSGDGSIRLFLHDGIDTSLQQRSEHTITTFTKNLSDSERRSVVALCSHRNLLCSAVTSTDKTKRNNIEIWDVDENVRKNCVEGHSDLINTLASNGDHLFSGGMDEAIFMWDIGRPGKELRQFFTNTPISNFIWDEKSKCLLTSYSSCSDIEAWDLRVAKCVRRFIGHSSTVTSLCNHFGHVCSGGEDGSVRIWDSSNNSKCLNVLQLASRVNSVSTVSLLGGRMEKVLCSSLDNGQVVLHHNAYLPNSEVCLTRIHCANTPLCST